MRKQYHTRPTPDGTLIWDVDRLVELSKNFDVNEVPLADIKELDENFWFQGEDDVPTCREIAEHAKLIKETDLKYPIILSAEGHVMDGMHRVAKAYIRGKKTIKAVQFEEDPEPDYKDEHLDNLPY